MLWALLMLQAVPDSARAQVYDRIGVVADSLSALRGAAARFRQDLANASDALVVTRAKRVRGGCANSVVAVDSLAASLARRTFATPRGPANQRTLQQELNALRQTLVRCQREWYADAPRARADSLRAWGPFRLTALEGAMRRYEQLATQFRGYVAPPDTTSSR